ncbi:YncE family protein [Dictyobacter arantiisoli]|uniref:YncE family protein n=1 Tax=Dictyobacter arantiisoli TaxID=2014874 RepID=A0A5A5TKK1_9CHLR|nr:hypothetical protein [Dictyobacter arantiisoli]GCF11434.1 hypothetical protein KDI_49980 [Dictyobacter arantiisoli]
MRQTSNASAPGRRRWLWSSIPLLLCLLFSTGTVPVWADGGAPNLAYVAGTSADISVIDVTQQKVTRTIATTGDVYSLLLSIDGRYLYVSQPQLGRVAILAANTGNLICSVPLSGQPAFLALDPINTVLYVAGNHTDMITVLNATNCKIQHILHASTSINGIALAFAGTNLPEGNDTRLWATTPLGLAAFNTRTGQLIASIRLPEEARAITIPPGKTAYVTTKQGPIYALDLLSAQTVSIMKSSNYGSMDFDELTSEIYVPDPQDDTLEILAPVTLGYATPHEPLRSIHFDSPPTSVAITNDGQLGFVTRKNGQVSMLDLPGKQTITTFAVGGSPHFVITGVYPPLAPLNAQEITLSGIIVTVGAYGLLAVMLIGPGIYFLLLLRRRWRVQNRIQ